MNYRPLGLTGLKVSETSFGAWGIGGQAYGRAERSESLAALARAEELGCNLVDTAAVYGDSESLIGEFLRSRRSKWIVSTKYSGQAGGLEATLEAQLRTLRIDHVDLYLLHWVPADTDGSIYDALARVRRAGKARFVGFSVYTIHDIRRVLAYGQADAIMLPFSVLDPDPFLAVRASIMASGIGVIARSALKEGFLTGRFTATSSFTDPSDQRSKWPQAKVAATAGLAERFRFLEVDAGSMTVGAARYPLSFPEVSSVSVGTRSPTQADLNFGTVPAGRLSTRCLEQVRAVQARMALHDRRGRFTDSVRGILRRLQGTPVPDS